MIKIGRSLTITMLLIALLTVLVMLSTGCNKKQSMPDKYKRTGEVAEGFTVYEMSDYFKIQVPSDFKKSDEFWEEAKIVVWSVPEEKIRLSIVRRDDVPAGMSLAEVEKWSHPAEQEKIEWGSLEKIKVNGREAVRKEGKGKEKQGKALLIDVRARPRSKIVYTLMFICGQEKAFEDNLEDFNTIISSFEITEKEESN